LRRVGFDLHQHELIDVYLGLCHYGLGHWREAAAFSLDFLQVTLRTHNLRGTSAALEVAAFLAIRRNRADICARMLGKAVDIRERTRIPLFSFWLIPEQEATSAGRRVLGDRQFDTFHAAGASARDELVIDEAREFLRAVAEGHGLALESSA
jgi:hypothetical protein